MRPKLCLGWEKPWLGGRHGFAVAVDTGGRSTWLGMSEKWTVEDWEKGILGGTQGETE